MPVINKESVDILNKLVARAIDRLKTTETPIEQISDRKKQLNSMVKTLTSKELPKTKDVFVKHLQSFDWLVGYVASTERHQHARGILLMVTSDLEVSFTDESPRVFKSTLKRASETICTFLQKLV